MSIDNSGPQLSKSIGLYLPVIIVVLISTPLYSSYQKEKSPETGLVNLSSLATKLNLNPGSYAGWQADFNGLDEQLHYSTANRSLEISAIVYNQQYQGKELINDTNRIVNKKGWKLNDEPNYETEYLTTNRLTASSRTNDQNQAVYYWYEVSGAFTTNKHAAKFLELRNLIFPKSPSILWVVTEACTGQDQCQNNPDKTKRVVEILTKERT